MAEKLKGWRLIAQTLKEKGGTLTVNDLATLTGIAPSNVRLLLRRMATYGTVARTSYLRKNPPTAGQKAGEWTVTVYGERAAVRPRKKRVTK